MHVSQKMWPQLETAKFDPLAVKHLLQWNQSICSPVGFLLCKEAESHKYVRLVCLFFLQAGGQIDEHR